jgi:GNAT superfamily N-acetyltransferase
MKPKRPKQSIQAICLQHFYESLACFSVIPDVNVESSGAVTQTISPNIPNWLTNAVFNMRLPSNHIAAVIEDITQYYRERNVAPFWRLCPHDSPGNLEQHLHNAGYQQKTKHIMMSVDLNTISAAPFVLDNTPIKLITSASELRKKHPSFRQIKDNYGKTFATLMRDLFDFHGYKHDSSWQHYVAIQDDDSVGYASAFYTKDVVGIYNVGVLPDARRKGIATALTMQALRDARERGYQFGTLQSSEMAQSMYQKIGFQAHFPIKYFAPA